MLSLAARCRTTSCMCTHRMLAASVGDSSSTTVFQPRRGTWYVSSAGRLQSASGVISFGTLHASGYRVAHIDGQKFYVHRLVACAFLGPPPTAEHWQVNHIDGCPSSNHLSNLQYATQAQNARHSWALGARHGPRCRGKAVLGRMCGAESWSSFPSQTQAARSLGLSSSQVSRCCRRVAAKCRTTTGTWYEFKFVELAQLRQNGKADELWEDAKYPGNSGIDSIPGMMISSHGRVGFTHAKGIHATLGSCRRDGYLSVQKAGRNFLVHRLVMASFHGQPQSAGMHVNHLDGNRGNNHLSNLEYATPSQNVLHGLALRFVSKPRPRPGRGVWARHLRFQQSWCFFSSFRAAALRSGVNARDIAQACNGHKPSQVGWEFKSAEEPLPDEEWRPVVLEGARVNKTWQHDDFVRSTVISREK